MTILDTLSSRVGDRSEYSNRKAAVACARRPVLLKEIFAGLEGEDAKLAADCAEVITQVAEVKPGLIAPYTGKLAKLVEHKTTQVRWEAVHTLALLASLKPRTIGGLLPTLGNLIEHDKSVIVRDWAVQAIGNYAGTGAGAARAAFPYLKEALLLWDGKQAQHALNGLAQVARRVPALRAELRAIGEAYSAHPRGMVKKAAKNLVNNL